MRWRWIVPLALPLALVPRSATAQLVCCYQITGIDTRTGVVSAAESASQSTLRFQVRDRAVLARLRTNQRVYVDLEARRVGLDARTPCCTILGTPAGAAPSLAPQPRPSGRPAPPQRPSDPPIPARQTRISSDLPSIAFGPPQKRAVAKRRPTSRFETQAISTTVAGRSATGSVLHLRGLKAVEEAPGLPDDARRMLIMAVRRVPRGQSDHYVVNTELAREWFATHDVPDDIKPTEPAEKKCDNWYDSWDCAEEAASDEWERTFGHAEDEWKRGTKRLAEAWETAQECFSERTLALPNIPITFAVEPTMTVDLERSAGRGGASGKVTGSVGFGVPMEGDFVARLELFYIPCLPFAVRPKALAAEGTMTVGEAIEGRITASGTYKKTFTIPPSGGPVIPIQVFPIIIAGVPVSELDVSAYVEGTIEVSADGEADGRFHLSNTHPTRFKFSCDGGGCTARSQGVPSTSTTSQGAELRGRMSVKPAIYTALQLNFNYEALSARAGPQPYVLGVATGCGAVSSTQTSAGASTSESSYALTGDLDWGIELRAEALVLRNIVGTPYVRRLMPEKHVWFRDLAPGGSSGLTALAVGPPTTDVGEPAAYKVRMPPCYPYPDRVDYRVAWTGNATPLPVAGCSWEAGGGKCRADPARDLLVTLTWPTAGTHEVSFVAVGDAHGRAFAPAPAPRRVPVTVTPSP